MSAYRARGPEPAATRVPADIRAGLARDPHVLAPRLAAHLVSGSDDPFLQVKALHDWVALNIACDTAAYFSGALRAQDFTAVLTRGRAVCSGYAQLFHRLAGDAGIQSYIISGYARGYGSSVFDDGLPAASNHAWNAVEIDGAWYLLDPTWNSGHVDGRTFRRSYGTEYLFLEPELMIHSHFPTASGHQLLESPLSRAEFSDLPFYRGAFFAAQLAPIEGVTRIMPAADRAVVEFDVPPGLRFSATMVDPDENEQPDRTMIKRMGGRAVLHVTFPAAGRWAVRLFAGTGSGSLGWVGDLGFEATGGTADLFPKRYSPFSEHGVVLHAPVHGPLRSGEIREFEVDLPGYVEAYLSAGSERLALTRREPGHRFHGQLEIPRAGELTLYGRRDPRVRRYHGIVAWPVQ